METDTSAPLVARLEAAARLLGVSPRAKSRARKHGYRPEARRHVERFLLREVLGARAADLSRSEGYSLSYVYHSIRLGRLIARENAGALGLTAEGLGVVLGRGSGDDDDEP